MAQPGDVADYVLVRWLRARGLRWCRHGLLLQAGGVPEGVGRCRRWRAALGLTDYPTALGDALPGSARRGMRVPRSAVLTLAV